MSAERFWAIVLGLLFVSALGLRLTRLDLTPYNIDEALLSIFAKQTGTLREFPLWGIRTSFGFHNPPLLVWLMAPFFAVTSDPRLAMAAMALAGAAAVPLTGVAVSGITTQRVGLIAAAVVAFSPAAIDHSRRLWGHDTIVFFAALCLFAAVQAINRNNWKWMAGSMAAAAAAQCCHLSGALLWVLPPGVLIAFRPVWWRRAVAGGVVIFVCLYLPWLVKDAGLTGEKPFVETGLILRIVTGQAEGAGTAGHSSPWLSWLCVTTDLSHSDAVGDSWTRFFDKRPVLGVTRWVVSLVMAGFVIAGVACAFRCRGEKRRWMWVLSASAAAPLALFVVLPVSSVPGYQLPALVPCAVLAAVALEAARIRRMHLGLGVLGLFVVWAHWQTFAMRSFLAGADWDDRVGGLLRYKRAAIRHVAEEGGEPGSYAVSQDGRLPETGVDYWVLYLHFAETGVAEAPTGAADRLFVVRSNGTRLRPEVAAALEPAPHTEIGPWRVYDFAGPEAGGWRDVVRRFPAVR